MSQQDQERWDRRHRRSMPAPVIEPPPPPPVFAHVEDLFPVEGKALDIACGRGEGAAWIASRGMDYRGVDVSPVAVDMARDFVSAYPFSERCQFDVWDLDDGLPPGDPVDLLFCHMFRPRDLYDEMVERVAPGGVLAVAALSNVGAEAGRYRCEPGELSDAFGALEILDHGEGEGVARIVARGTGSVSR